MDNVKGQKLAKDGTESRIFHDITFCQSTNAAVSLIAYRTDIPRGSAKHKKADLEALVHRHGGEFSQAQLSDLSAYVIAPDDKSECIVITNPCRRRLRVI